MGSEVTYHCDDGLFPTGVMTSKCTDVGGLRGQWVPDPAQLMCHAIPGTVGHIAFITVEPLTVDTSEIKTSSLL